MTMPESPSGFIANADRAMKSRRLRQITNILICAFAAGTLQFSLQRQWKFSIVLFVGILLLLTCQWLNRRGAKHAANLLLLILSICLCFVFSWEAEGLFDEILLALPLLLVMAGLVVNKKQFFVLLVAVLVFNVLIYFGTEWGWRHDVYPVGSLPRLLNIELILLVGGLMINIGVNDLNSSISYLKAQIKNYHDSEKKLTYSAQHDELTGLPNRVYGRELLENAVYDAQANQGTFALLFVDLDHFKLINDSLGHLAGDRFLLQMAERLTMTLGDAHIVCRLGGDEFLIGITDAADVGKVTAIAQQIMGTISRPLQDMGTEVIASCTIGIALYPRDGADFDILLTHADMAMFAAKEMGRNTYLFFDESLNVAAQENLKLISALRSATLHNEFVLHYQPVFELPGRKIVGAEALIRWQRPGFGLLHPTDFVPAAEKSGLILEMGEWVIEEACRQMKEWQDAGVAPEALAVNISPLQFKRGNIAEVIGKTLARYELNPSCFEFELTESTVIENPNAFMAKLQELKALGVNIAIDDFGTGYSNLSYLQRFPVNKLKIDQSFVKRLQNGPQDQAIVTAIIQLAKSLNLKTVAEGIEDGATYGHLVDLQCGYGQGYWLARPLPAQEFTALCGVTSGLK